MSNNDSFCPKCGNPKNGGSKRCAICGYTGSSKKLDNVFASIEPAKNNGKPKRRLIVILLAFIGFGFGYYYLGYRGKFIDRAIVFLKSFFYTITLVLAPLGFFYMFYFIILTFWDIFYLIFVVKKDAFGNKIKF